LYIFENETTNCFSLVSLGVGDHASEVSDATSETTYVAMQPQEGHVEETITSMDTSDDVS
jgi:hypothetical protein